MVSSFENYDYWNSLIKIRDNTKDQEVKHKAEMLLGQLNTAAGKHFLKNEIEIFITQNKCCLNENCNDTIIKLNDENWFRKEDRNVDYMADTNIKVILQAAQYLDELINKDSDNIPDWIEDKLSKCASDMQSIHDYFKSLKSD